VNRAVRVPVDDEPVRTETPSATPEVVLDPALEALLRRLVTPPTCRGGVCCAWGA
jgi:hypothetical protein